MNIHSFPRPFIKAGEGLILKTSYNEYEGTGGPFHTKDDVLAYCIDDTKVILHDVGHIVDDITEEMAGHWLDRHPDIDPHDWVPPFVRYSANYEHFLSEFEEPEFAGYHMEAGRQ